MAGVLKILGVDFGKNLLGYDSGNIKGHFEHNDILNINDEILTTLASSWDDTKPLPDNWHKDQRISSHKKRIKEVLQRDFSASSLFGIKEPRVSILLPLYLDILYEMDIAPFFVVMQRSDKEIAESLYSRDKMPFEQSLKLSRKYKEAIMESSGCVKKVVIEFNELLKNPELVIENIQNSLGISFKDFTSARKELLEFIDPGLKHFNAGKFTARTIKNRITQAIDSILPIDTKRRKTVKYLVKILQRK